MRWAGLAVAITATAIYLVLVAKQLNRPLMYDDANFALGARAVAETGKPFGNQGWMGDRGDLSQREQWALWHPPLYIYAEGTLAKLGGWTPPVLRLLGVLGGIATAALTWQLARDLTRGPPVAKDIAGGSAVALVLLSPVVVQSALIVDVDFALLLPLTLLFLVLYLRLEATRAAWLWMAPVLAVLLWAKMTNPLTIVPVLAVWQALRGKFLRAAVHLVGIGVVGVALFGVSWLVIGTVLGFPLDMPFGVNLAEWQDSADVARRAYTSPGAFIEGLQPTVLWLGPGIVALGLLGVEVRAAQLVRTWTFTRADLLIGLTIIFVVGYVNKSAGWFPKYQVALAPLLACLAAPLVASAWCARPRLVALLALSGVVGSFAVTGALIRDDWALQRTWAIDPSGALWLGAIVVAAGLIGIGWRAPAATATMGVVGLAVGWSLAVDLIQERAPYQTDYWYGTTGTLEAIDWVNAHIAPDQTYVAAKEVAIRSAAQRYVDQDDIVYLLGVGYSFDGTWAGEQIHALVAWQREPYVAQLLANSLPNYGFREAERFGDYVVYVPS